jgi:hypothetical protein
LAKRDVPIDAGFGLCVHIPVVSESFALVTLASRPAIPRDRDGTIANSSRIDARCDHRRFVPISLEIRRGCVEINFSAILISE